MTSSTWRGVGAAIAMTTITVGCGGAARPTLPPQTAPVAAAPTDPRCDEPGRFLATVPLAALPSTMATACQVEAWRAPAADACAEREALWHGLLAELGYPFRTPAVRASFAATSWYQPRDDFWGGDLAEVPAANEQALRGCDAPDRFPTIDELTASTVTAADLRTVYAWFAAKQAGDLRLPATLEADGGPVSADEMRTWLSYDGLFTLSAWTPIDYGFDPVAPPGVRPPGPTVITVGTSVHQLECVDYGNEDCEGYEWISFTLGTGGAIVGIAVGAAACPFVYVEHAGAEVRYQGEVLRNLVGAAREGHQELPVRLPPSCVDGGVALHLVEGKPEQTFLDEVALRVGDQRIVPDACGIAPAPAYCDADGQHTVLARGDALRLTFALPAGAACDDAALQADGYYLPTEPTFGWITGAE